eukprot:6881623-Prymnesium_polylepis.2
MKARKRQAHVEFARVVPCLGRSLAAVVTRREGGLCRLPAVHPLRVLHHEARARLGQPVPLEARPPRPMRHSHRT